MEDRLRLLDLAIAAILIRILRWIHVRDRWKWKVFLQGRQLHPGTPQQSAFASCIVATGDYPEWK